MEKNEPYEILVVDVPAEFSGKVIDLVTQRKGEMLSWKPKVKCSIWNLKFLQED